MEIPKIDEGKVVIIYAESMTDIILNLDKTRYENGVGENYYDIADNIQLGRERAVKAVLESNNSVEAILYDCEGVYIELIR